MTDATVQVVCPSCDTTNRLPRARLADKPTCGRCKAPLFAGHPVPLTGKNFDAHLAGTGIPLVVDFWAPWCGPCKMMAPVFEKAAGMIEPRVRLAKVNTDEEAELARRHNIASIPTLVIFSAGKEVARLPGAQPLERLTAWIRQHLGT